MAFACLRGVKYLCFQISRSQLHEVVRESNAFLPLFCKGTPGYPFPEAGLTPGAGQFHSSWELNIGHSGR